jgi:hypothetical protein
MDMAWKNFTKKKLLDDDGFFEKSRQKQWAEWGDYVLLRYEDPMPTVTESF